MQSIGPRIKIHLANGDESHHFIHIFRLGIRRFGSWSPVILMSDEWKQPLQKTKMSSKGAHVSINSRLTDSVLLLHFLNGVVHHKSAAGQVKFLQRLLP